MPNESDHDEVLKALEQALEENPQLQGLPAEEVARQLVRGGYLGEEPPLALLEDMLEGTGEAEEPRRPFGAGASEEGAMRAPAMRGTFRNQWEAEPMAEPVDLEAERRELEEAGWEPIERAGKLVWRNPKSGHLYPQGAAISVLRRGLIEDD